MENLDSTIIVTALPRMAQSFGTDPVSLNIGVTAYTLTLAVFIPISGWMADRFGARHVFAAAIAMFTGASVLCGFSQGQWSFIACRVLQGTGGAMMMPVGRLVMLRAAEKRDLVRLISYIALSGLVAPVLGPPVGGPSPHTSAGVGSSLPIRITPTPTKSSVFINIAWFRSPCSPTSSP
jgi:MFS family permease